MARILIPPAHVPAIDKNGLLAKQWYVALSQLLQAQQNSIEDVIIDAELAEPEVPSAFGEAIKRLDNLEKDEIVFPDSRITALEKRINDLEKDLQPDYASKIAALEKRLADLERDQWDFPLGTITALSKRLDDLERDDLVPPTGQLSALESRISALEVDHEMMVHPTPLAYEQGSWTPTLIGLTTAGAHTYSQQVGRYRRIGDVIMAWGVLRLSAKDAAMAGAVYMSGLPYASANISNLVYPVAMGRLTNIDLTAGYTQVHGRINAGESRVELQELSDNASSLTLTPTSITNTSAFGITAVYRID